MNELRNQLNDQDLIDRSKIIKKNLKSSQKSSIIIIFVIFIITVVLFLVTLSLIFLLLSGNQMQDYMQIYYVVMISFIALALIFYFSLIAPLTIVTYVSYRRTSYRGFLYESTITAQFLLIPVLAIILNVIGQIYLSFLTWILIFVIKFEYKFVKKPLIWGNKFFGYEKNVFSDGTDIISKQSLYINEFRDGYSTRPMFINIKEILDKKSNEQEITTELENYANLLGSKGDIIGFTTNEMLMKLYLRTTLIQTMKVYLIKSQFKKAIQIIKKDDLTSITINFKEGEMNLYLNREDYEFLGDLTYQKLSRRILEQFKISLREFFNYNYENALKAINPPIDNLSS